MSFAADNRTLKRSYFFIFQFVIIVIIVDSVYIQPYYLFGQPVLSHSLSDNSKKECSPVRIHNINTSDNRTLFLSSMVLDNNINPTWSSGGLGSWIQLDLGISKNICDLDIAWHEGKERHNNFTIFASNDGKKFSHVLTTNSSGFLSSTEKYVISDTNARYLKIEMNRNTENGHADIAEIPVTVESILPKYTIGAAGDRGSARNDNWKNTVQLMVDNKVNLALGLGDYSYGGMEQFIPVVDEVQDAGILMKGAKGDHDSNSCGKLFQQDSMTLGFDAGSARIIILDPESSPYSNSIFL